MNSFKSRPQTITAVQFDGHNNADVEALIGAAGVVLPDIDGTLTVYTKNDVQPRHIIPWWWVSITADGDITSHSAEAFERGWEPAQKN